MSPRSSTIDRQGRKTAPNDTYTWLLLVSAFFTAVAIGYVCYQLQDHYHFFSKPEASRSF